MAFDDNGFPQHPECLVILQLFHKMISWLHANKEGVEEGRVGKGRGITVIGGVGGWPIVTVNSYIFIVYVYIAHGIMKSWTGFDHYCPHPHSLI